MSDIQQSLGARLRLKRKELGWSQAKLAEYAKTTPGAVQKIENDKSLHPRNLQRFAAALGVSAAWLAFGVATVAELDPEALPVAKAWSELREPARSEAKQAIFNTLEAQLAELEFGDPEHLREWILAVRSLRDERLVAREEAFFMVAWAVERLAEDRLGQPIRPEICWDYGQWEMARLLENDPAEFGRRRAMGREAILGPYWPKLCH
jgi:transcriptional regulator with XRE-family HTH domain